MDPRLNKDFRTFATITKKWWFFKSLAAFVQFKRTYEELSSL